MKTCTKCLENKSETEFFIKDKKKGRLHAQCKQCYQIHRQTYHQQHYQKYRENYLRGAKLRRQKLRTAFHDNLRLYLADKYCVICGENDIRVLEFDHLEPKDKLFSISQANRLGYGWEATLVEIAKCRILCANCHKKHTSDQFNWYKKI